MRLTVAIPTYNRNAILKATLERFLPQFTEACKLLILDNHSDVPVEETLGDLLAMYPGVECRIVRNAANIGGAANILRCFEYCDTEWMWLFGDDDHPTQDGLATVLRNLDEHPHCCFFNFVSPHFSRARARTVRGLREFVDAIDSWSNLLFMSVAVYHCPSVLSQLRFGYHFAYSLAPQIAILLASLGEQGISRLCAECIIQDQSPAEWAAVNLLMGKAALLDLPMDDDVRRSLAAKLQHRPSLEAIAVMLTRAARIEQNWRHAIYQYDQICSRVYYFDRSWWTRARMACYRTLVRFYPIGYPALLALFPVLKRLMGLGHVHWESVTVPERFHRL